MKRRWFCLALIVGMFVGEPLLAQGRFRFRSRRHAPIYAPIQEAPAPADSSTTQTPRKLGSDVPPALTLPSVPPASSAGGGAALIGGARPLAIQGRPAPASGSATAASGQGTGSIAPAAYFQRPVAASILAEEAKGPRPAPGKDVPPAGAASVRPPAASAGAFGGVSASGSAPARAPNFVPANSTRLPAGANGSVPAAISRPAPASSGK
jgi:hypothetical protein